MWQPTASIPLLKLRAEIIRKIRQFFYDRHIMEVDTLAISHATITDPHLHSISVSLNAYPTQRFYLQTSPEFAMKRLLAAGSGAIFQLAKAFRDDEIGRYHQPEFTMLEWYRPGFDHHQLMNEVEALLQLILTCPPAIKLSYQKLFQNHLAVDPIHCELDALHQLISYYELNVVGLDINNRDELLQLLMTHIIEPKLKGKHLYFIYDYPASQAALAKIRVKEQVAERFEVYYEGIELANGFHELCNAEEQLKRFYNDLKKREDLNLPLVPIDGHLIAALEQGLPACAGIALGVDRLIMLAAKANKIDDVVAFTIDNA